MTFPIDDVGVMIMLAVYSFLLAQTALDWW
jgi:hypothetical protein